MGTSGFFILFSLNLVSSVLGQESNFKSGALTVAVVATDAAESLYFYKDILGLQEVGGFSIDSSFAKRLGLSGEVPFEVARLAFDDQPGSSQIKLVSFAPSINEKLQAIPSTIQQQSGLQYITLKIHRLDGVMQRVKEPVYNLKQKHLYN